MTQKKQDLMDKEIQETYKDIFSDDNNSAFDGTHIPSKEVFFKGTIKKIERENLEQ